MFYIIYYQGHASKTIRQYCTLSRIAKVLNTEATNAGKDMQQEKLVLTTGQNAKWLMVQFTYLNTTIIFTSVLPLFILWCWDETKDPMNVGKVLYH